MCLRLAQLEEAGVLKNENSAMANSEGNTSVQPPMVK
jgi:hypothetical protein